MFQNYILNISTVPIVHIKKNPSKLIGIISQDTPNACAIIELIMLIMREVFFNIVSDYIAFIN